MIYLPDDKVSAVDTGNHPAIQVFVIPFIKERTVIQASRALPHGTAHMIFLLIHISINNGASCVQVRYSDGAGSNGPSLKKPQGGI